jgi:FKBP-type peptidyl-prolyl cis-trans isomerase
MKWGWLAVATALAGLGVAHAQDVSSEKGKVSYALGYDLGRRLAESRIDVDLNTLDRAIQDGMSHRNPALPDRTMAQIMQSVQQKQLAKAKADFERTAADNKAASDWFMAKNHARAFVKTLPNGIQYRVIEEGNGPIPRADGQVRIMYKASISTGQVFATSYGGDGVSAQPVTVTINQSPLQGIRQILPMMKQGARWEIVLPPEQAYGSGPDSPIGPNQAVMFDLKVVEVLK